MPGVVTAGLVCTMLQFAYNELGIARIKYVSRKLQPPPPPPAPSTSSSVVPQPALPAPQVDDEPKLSLSERVFTALGWHKVSDEQYLERLKLKRGMYLHRIAELEREMAEEAKHQAESHENP